MLSFYSKASILAALFYSPSVTRGIVGSARCNHCLLGPSKLQILSWKNQLMGGRLMVEVLSVIIAGSLGKATVVI